MGVDELKEKLCNNEGPKVQATQPDYVKFHDDKVTVIVCPMSGTAYYSIAGPAAHDLRNIYAFTCLKQHKSALGTCIHTYGKHSWAAHVLLMLYH